MMNVEARVTFNHLPRLRGQMRTRASQAVREATTAVEQQARARSRVDTGTMQQGWTSDIRELQGVVRNTVPYVVFNEYGTRKMSAQPMATPAAELVRTAFVTAMRSLFDV